MENNGQPDLSHLQTQTFALIDAYGGLDETDFNNMGTSLYKLLNAPTDESVAMLAAYLEQRAARNNVQMPEAEASGPRL